MATQLDEFTLESVRDYMIFRGGRVTNHDLVKHFKVFLTNPACKGKFPAKLMSLMSEKCIVYIDNFTCCNQLMSGSVFIFVLITRLLMKKVCFVNFLKFTIMPLHSMYILPKDKLKITQNLG